MGRMYTGAFAPSAQTAALDWFEITSPTTKVCFLHGIDISQTTEVGDAQEEMIEWAIKRGTSGTTSGSTGGTAIGPTTVGGTGDSASGSTLEVLNTSKMAAGGGSIVTLHRSAFNVRNGLLWLPTPEMRAVWAAGERLTIELVAAPADSVTWVGTVYWEELG